jgi:amino acid permease
MSKYGNNELNPSQYASSEGTGRSSYSRHDENAD